MTANNSTKNKVLFSSFTFENSMLQQLLIFDPNALDKKEKIFCVTTYLETKSIKIVLKYDTIN